MTFEQFTKQHTALLSTAEARDGVWQLTTTPKQAIRLLEALRPLFDYPEDLTCVDEGESLRLFYRLYSTAERQTVHLCVPGLPRTGAHQPTASALWRGYEWQEREVYDLFGVVFDGHPDLRRILTWEGFPGHPLLKDYVVDNNDSSWEIPEQLEEEIIDLLLQDDTTVK